MPSAARHLIQKRYNDTIIFVLGIVQRPTSVPLYHSLFLQLQVKPLTWRGCNPRYSNVIYVLFAFKYDISGNLLYVIVCIVLLFLYIDNEIK